jgi:hypothetical protein
MGAQPRETGDCTGNVVLRIDDRFLAPLLSVTYRYITLIPIFWLGCPYVPLPVIGYMFLTEHILNAFGNSIVAMLLS